MNLSTLIPSLIRTYTPVIVGQVVSWLLMLNIVLPSQAQAGLAVFLGGFLTAIYYTIVRLLEQRFPGVGVLLGLPKSPDSYSNENTIPGEVVQDDPLPAYPDPLEDDEPAEEPELGALRPAHRA